ncbi:RNA pseudouridine synthase [Odoribacter laneus]|jgi:pseudouridylate synthase|uniref:RluA family pseudouridine synthase n=1 Tax=Odoribacter laneus YIT 12061 TaxID=742817 RepID=H1DFZ9_9BACT|nr:RluA family pseudouridine synthase [Odoribacter laneus YIT 12061]GKI23464.1 RNA pseudouridine synthase [Odoribacter laneus]GKI24259.1 RNA pseudouridine synthase [Odoribacter laneus]CCZ80772.1 rluA family pseudouridine synthase [Odoribacter laneus CAG:561]
MLEILYEDNHIIAINKKTSDIVQADKSGDVPLSEEVKAYIKEKYNKPGEVFLGIPHRIDRPVSGVVLFARTTKALTRLNKMFQEHDEEIKKTYWAIVGNLPSQDSATLIHYMVRDTEKNKSHAYDKEKKGSKKAILEYKLIGRSQRYYLLEIKLLTGRHHQIRCQLAKIGCPIKGDLKYGFPRSNENGGISLHAREISFIHPVSKERITITATPPLKDNLWKEFYQNL